MLIVFFLLHRIKASALIWIFCVLHFLIIATDFIVIMVYVRLKSIKWFQKLTKVYFKICLKHQIIL